MNQPALLIMAAGMGSRFGGPKQITPVDANGHILIDFSLYDAWRAGFRTVVFIIKPEMEPDFRQTIGAHIAPFFEVQYVHQRLDCLPQGYGVPAGRVKPWGTGHAVACAAEALRGQPFAVINADDYYGRDAMQAIYQFLAANGAPNAHAMVGYQLRNTVTEFGYVARGVCQMENGFLTGITERTHIEKRGADAAYLEGDREYPLPGDTVVSMNLWGFRPMILDELWRRMPAFLDKTLAENPLKGEYFLPSVADAQIHEGLGTVRVLKTNAQWHGVTYREDLESVQAALAEMTAQGIYPTHLWDPANLNKA